MRPISCAIVFMALLTHPASGQRVALLRFAPAPVPPVADAEPFAYAEDRPTVLAQGLVGLGGGLLGFAAGASLGYVAASSACQGSLEFCLAWIVAGGVAGQSIGIPLAVHHASGRRTELGRSTAVSGAIGGLSLLLLFASGDNAFIDLPLAVLTPLLQIGFSIRSEATDGLKP